MKFLTFDTYPELKMSKDLILDIMSYGTVLNMLLIEKVQIYFDKKIKINTLRLFLKEKIEGQHNFVFDPIVNENPKKSPFQGLLICIVGFDDMNWGVVDEQEKKRFLISKWIIFFENIPQTYFLVKKDTIIKILQNLINEKWEVVIEIPSKKIKFNQKIYSFELNIKPQKTVLSLISDIDKFEIEIFQTNEILYKTNFSKVNLKGNLLTLKREMWTEKEVLFDMTTRKLII